MKRRIRKKLHVGEYQELGFYVQFHVSKNAEDPNFEGFLDECISEIEHQNLGFGGGTGAVWDGFVVNLNPHRRGRRSGSVIEEQRLNLKQWLERHPRVSEIHVSPLVDAWYGPFE